MSTVPILSYTNQVPVYAFLSKPPPPPQKKRPTQPLPAPPSPPVPQPLVRRRSNTFSAINSWASHVQPGSPAPRSPRRRPSIAGSASRRPSLTRLPGRRPSVSHSRVPSGSFLNFLDTPSTGTAHRSFNTPSIKDFSTDLTALGYTSVFVHLPKTPDSAFPFPALSKPPSPYSARHIPVVPISSTPAKIPTLKRFRSLSVLKPIRSRSKSAARAMPSSPTKLQHISAKVKASTIAKRKKAMYSAYSRPAPLANELALMQFMDGGSLESHSKRVMEAQAKAAAGSGGVSAAGVGVADVYRDGKGGLWWDQEEELEYVHLLNGQEDSEMVGDWVRFGDDGGDKENDGTGCAMAGLELAGDDRRGSVSTQDSDLDARFLVQPADDQLNTANPVVPAPRKAGLTMLTLPSRAKHLRKPEFLIDVIAFYPPSSPTKPHTPTSRSKPKGAARRRPAPLKLTPPGPGLKRPSNSPDHTTEKVRQEFIEASFAPSPTPLSPLSLSPELCLARVQTATSVAVMRSRGRMQNVNFAGMRSDVAVHAASSGLRGKASKLNMRNLFKSVRRDA